MCTFISWDCVNTVITCITTVVVTILAALTFIRGIPEYRRQGFQKKMDFLITMKTKLRENNAFKCICDVLDEKVEGFGDVSPEDKSEFICFFEEVAIMLKSKFICEKEAYYMFGYYAIRCSRNHAFEKGFPYKGSSWRLFDDFVMKMKRIEKDENEKREREFKKSAYRV